MLHEWEVLLRLAGIVARQGPEADLAALDEFVARQVLQRGVANALSPAHGVELETAWPEVSGRRGPSFPSRSSPGCRRERRFPCASANPTLPPSRWSGPRPGRS